jgi:hypothetical protein
MIAQFHQVSPAQFPLPAIRFRPAVSQFAAQTGKLRDRFMHLGTLAADASYAVSRGGRLVLAGRRSSAAQPDPLF